MTYNLTPHEVVYADGENFMRFPPQTPLRVTQRYEPLPCVNGLPVGRVEYTEVVGLPEVQAGDVLIVSTIAAEAIRKTPLPEWVYILVPDSGPTATRNEAGQIESVRRFIQVMP